jgi:hypothetical protein
MVNVWIKKYLQSRKVLHETAISYDVGGSRVKKETSFFFSDRRDT